MALLPPLAKAGTLTGPALAVYRAVQSYRKSEPGHWRIQLGPPGVKTGQRPTKRPPTEAASAMPSGVPILESGPWPIWRICRRSRDARTLRRHSARHIIVQPAAAVRVSPYLGHCGINHGI